MAYNILKGAVEFTGDNGSLENTVDLASDQSIAGGKTFAQKLTASAISLGGSVLEHPALTAIGGDGAGRLIVSDGDGTATCNANLTFLNSSLTSSYFSGSGQGLTNLQVTELSGTIQATQINLGTGVADSAGAVTVKPHDGITVDSDGVAILLNSTGGLGFNHDQGLLVDPTSATIITDSGQNLADADLFLVQDVTHGLRKSTLTNLYTNYIAGKLPSSISFNGSTANGLLTYGSATQADVESNLKFDGSVLQLTGSLFATSDLSSSLTLAGRNVIIGDGQTLGTNLLVGESLLKLTASYEGSAIEGLVLVSGSLSASSNISASMFYGDGSKLTGIAGGTPATASGGTGEIQFARTVDGEFSSDGAFVFNTGSAGAQGAYLTSSNVVVQYTTHMSGAVRKHYKHKEANYSLTGSDHIILFLGAGSTLTASLPNLNIDLNGIEYVVKNLGTDDVYVTASALTQQFIDGSGSLTIHKGDSLKLLAFYAGTGYEWAIIDYYNV